MNIYCIFPLKNIDNASINRNENIHLNIYPSYICTVVVEYKTLKYIWHLVKIKNNILNKFVKIYQTEKGLLEF